jgi:hypothetical protein
MYAPMTLVAGAISIRWPIAFVVIAAPRVEVTPG